MAKSPGTAYNCFLLPWKESGSDFFAVPSLVGNSGYASSQPSHLQARQTSGLCGKSKWTLAIQIVYEGKHDFPCF